MKWLKIAQMLNGLLVATLMGGCIVGSPAMAAAQDLPLRVGAMPISDALQAFVADGKGFFKQEGLKVTLTTLPGGAAIVSAIEGGSLDVGYSALVPVAQAYAKGFQFVVIGGASVWEEAAYRGKKSHLVIMIPKNSSVKTAKDLEGKKVSVVALKSVGDLVFTVWAERNGADPTKIHKIEMGFPQHEAALQRGQVDGVLQAEPFLTKTLESNVGVVLADYIYSAIAPRYQLGVWIAKKDWVESHPKEVSAFISAIRQATRYINGDLRGTREILTQYTKLSPELANKIALPIFSETWSREEFQVVIDVMSKHKYLSKPFEVDAMISRYMK